MILHEKFRVVSCFFPRYILCYISENRFRLGQCRVEGLLRFSKLLQIRCIILSSIPKAAKFSFSKKDYNSKNLQIFSFYLKNNCLKENFKLKDLYNFFRHPKWENLCLTWSKEKTSFSFKKIK